MNNEIIERATEAAWNLHANRDWASIPEAWKTFYRDKMRVGLETVQQADTSAKHDDEIDALRARIEDLEGIHAALRESCAARDRLYDACSRELDALRHVIRGALDALGNVEDDDALQCAAILHRALKASNETAQGYDK